MNSRLCALEDRGTILACSKASDALYGQWMAFFQELDEYIKTLEAGPAKTYALRLRKKSGEHYIEQGSLLAMTTERAHVATFLAELPTYCDVMGH